MYQNIYNNTIQNSLKLRTTHMPMNMDSVILGCSHRTEYDTALRMKKQELHTTIWMEFMSIVLSEKSRHRNSMILLHFF